ncbi:MAG: acyl-CoA dehydrogenase family protein [Pseudomonadota bacterium]|nr:acyl-CoA dehydrogenase family protein [Pseudomonadota bacterium]
MPDGTIKVADKALAEAELVDKAKRLAPQLADRARQAELDRRISDRTNTDLRDAGFYRALQPARYGGFELDYGAQTAFSRELGRVCASSAWVAGILACHGWIGGMFPDEAQGEIWSDDVDATIATSFLPVGVEVERRGDGIRISGRWRFSSGVDYCSWAILLVIVPPKGGQGNPDPVFALVDLTKCKIEDTWNSAGLTATGSNDIVVDRADVPSHRIMRVIDMRGEETPGFTANNSYLYRLPLFAVFPFNIIGPALGAARGALDAVIDDLTNRRSVTGADLSRSATVHQRVGRAAALLDSADAVIGQLRKEIVSKGKAGDQFSMPDRARYRLNLGHVARTCCDAVDELLPLTGGRGLESSHPMQRAWRDVHAVAQHIGLVWDLQTGLYGSVLLGHECPDPKL